MRESRTQGTWLAVLGLTLVMAAWSFAGPRLLPEAALGAKGHYGLMIAQELVFFGLPALLMRPWRLPGATRQWQGCALGLLAGTMLALLMNRASGAWTSLLRMAPAPQPMPVSAFEWTLALLALVAVPALAEEAFFRGGVLCGLRESVGNRRAFLLSVAVFTLMHGRLAALPAHLACGGLLSLGMLRYGSLGASLAAHLSYNAVMLALTWAGEPATGTMLAVAALGLAAIATVWARGVNWRGRGRIGVSGLVAVAALMMYFAVRLS